MENPVRIVVAEDISMTRIGLVTMINSIGAGRFTVVGEADNGRGALGLIGSLKPDIVLTDIRMPVMDGVALMENARELGYGCVFVVLSAYNDYEYVRRAMLLGAEDYLLKLDIDIPRLAELLESLYLKLRGKPAGLGAETPKRQQASSADGAEETDALVAQIGRELGRLDREGLDAAFGELARRITAYGVQPQMLYGICYTLVYMVSRFISEHRVKTDWSRSRELNDLMQDCHTREQYLGYIEGLNERCRALLKERGEHGEIRTAMLYMRDNLSRDLSLEDIAGQVNLNPSYFSRLFVKEAGKSCIDYLTEIRVDRAKELLTGTSGRISDISGKCGFNSQYYFSRIFKKVTGLTPVEWRKTSSG